MSGEYLVKGKQLNTGPKRGEVSGKGDWGHPAGTQLPVLTGGRGREWAQTRQAFRLASRKMKTFSFFKKSHFVASDLLG